MNSQDLQNLQEAYLSVYEATGRDEMLAANIARARVLKPTPSTSSIPSSRPTTTVNTPSTTKPSGPVAQAPKPTGGALGALDKFARDTAGRIGGEIGARQGREKFGNVLGIPERIGRNRGTQQGQQMYDKAKQTLGGLLNQDYEFDAFDIILEYLVSEKYAETDDEALELMTNMSEEMIQYILDEAPNKLKMTRLYHGTDSSAQRSIQSGGFRTDKNVTRQMRGQGVYSTPDKKAANMYANDRAAKRGTSPSRMELLVPSSRLKGAGANMVKGDTKFKAYGMQPSYANKTLQNKQPAIRSKNPSFSHSSPEEVKNRFRSNRKDTEMKRQSGTPTKPGVVRAAVHTRKLPPSGTKITMGKGGSSSLGNVGSSSGQSRKPSSGYTPGSGGRYGLSGIGLADSYELILSYLIDEGYAETPEAAEAIMVNMSEEWIEAIIG
jgi:hypothetical protein